MSTGIAVIDRNKFSPLAASAGEANAAMAAMMETGERISAADLIRVKTPSGGSTVWQIETPAGTQSVKTISGVLVCYQPRGVLWPSFDPKPGTQPVLTTLNPLDPNAIAEQRGPIPDHMLATLEKHRIDERHFRWADLPYNQWGSGKNGEGKLCKEQRDLFILPEGQMFPYRITAQPGSVKAVSKFFKLLAVTAQVPYWRCVVELALEKATSKTGQDYARIVPSLLGTIDAESGEVIRRQFTVALKEIVNDLDASVERDDEIDE